MKKLTKVLEVPLVICLAVGLYVYNESKTKRTAKIESDKFIEESNARADALDEELKPFIERNRKLDEDKTKVHGDVMP